MLDATGSVEKGLSNPLAQSDRVYESQLASVSSLKGASGLVVKSIVAIDGPRVRFAADALNRQTEV